MISYVSMAFELTKELMFVQSVLSPLCFLTNGPPVPTIDNCHIPICD